MAFLTENDLVFRNQLFHSTLSSQLNVNDSSNTYPVLIPETNVNICPPYLPEVIQLDGAIDDPYSPHPNYHSNQTNPYPPFWF